MHQAVATTASRVPDLVREEQSARDYAQHEKAASTRRAYRSSFAVFAAWCHDRGLIPVPALPVTVAAFLASQADAGVKPSTLALRTAAIRYAHRLAKDEDEAKPRREPPTASEQVRVVMRGIRRTIGAKPTRKAPATAERVAAMVRMAPDTLAGQRDRALLLIGFMGALRRSELVALRVEDVEHVPEGVRITIRRSKTDQEAQGQTIAIPHGARLQAVRALTTWLEAASLTAGPIFRAVAQGGRVQATPLTCRSVASIVKHYAAAAGFDPAAFSGHSLRAGFLSSREPEPVQDGGTVAAPEPGHTARLRAGCRAVPGPCGGAILILPGKRIPDRRKAEKRISDIRLANSGNYRPQGRDRQEHHHGEPGRGAAGLGTHRGRAGHRSAAKPCRVGAARGRRSARPRAGRGHGAAQRFAATVQAAARKADRVLIDTPPGFADPALLAALAADLVPLPAGPSPLDIMAARDALDLARQARTERGGKLPLIRFVPSKVTRTTLGRELPASLEAMGEPVLPEIGQRAAAPTLPCPA